MARSPEHHVRIVGGPLAGRWAGIVLLEPDSCVQADAYRQLEGAAIERAGALLGSAAVPGSWFTEFWPELGDCADVDFSHIELASAESLKFHSSSPFDR